MSKTFRLTFEGETLTTWTVPESIEFDYGQCVAVRYKGRTRPFVVIGCLPPDEIKLFPVFKQEERDNVN